MRRLSIFLMIAGIVVVAWAGPLIRLAEEAPAISVAFWRTTIASGVLLPIALIRKRGHITGVLKAEGSLIAASGAFLALHFVTWIASVNLTTVAASVLLVGSTPVWVVLVSAVFLKERFSARGWLGVLAAVLGSSIIAASGLSLYGTAVLGNALALGGALAGTGYLIIGRAVRPRVPLLIYVAAVYSVAAVTLAVVAGVSTTPLVGFQAKTWAAILALGAGPQLIGHTIFNFLLGELPAGKVAVVLMGEPIGSAIIAAFLFGEIPGILVLPGGLLLLGGIYLAVTSKVGVGSITTSD